MKVCMLIDPIENLDKKKDTSLALMLAAQHYNCSVYFTTIDKLCYSENRCFAQVTLLKLYKKNESDEIHYHILKKQYLPMTDFNLIFIRKDPPITLEYLYALMLLESVPNKETIILNTPNALLRSNEKLLILNFSQCCPPMIVSADREMLESFILHHKQVVLKSLNSMGGQAVYLINHDMANYNPLLHKITHQYQTPIMAQRYIPDITLGDKRIFLINGQPFPYALARIPKSGDFRGNLAQGATGIVQQLSPSDQWIAEQVGHQLQKMGHFLVGLDIIGEYLTEINVTSPTCAREISRESNTDLSHFIIEQALNLTKPPNAF